MVVVQAGRFIMGGNDFLVQQPTHSVTILKPFAIGKREVTFDEWAACVAGGGCRSHPDPGDRNWGRGNRPVIHVSWNDAKEYVAWLSERTGRTYRLLSEAEWEYAARAGTTTRYFWGNDAGKGNASCFNCGGQWENLQTYPAGSFRPNAWGLHDMHGNVGEWVEDSWFNSHIGAPADGSARYGGSLGWRVYRGGSWLSVGAESAGSAGRIGSPPTDRASSIGFRVGRTLY